MIEENLNTPEAQQVYNLICKSTTFNTHNDGKIGKKNK